MKAEDYLSKEYPFDKHGFIKFVPDADAILYLMEFYAQQVADERKQALREAIEKQIKYHEDTGPMAQESRSTEIGELKRFKEMLDTVTPK